MKAVTQTTVLSLRDYICKETQRAFLIKGALSLSLSAAVTSQPQSSQIEKIAFLVELLRTLSGHRVPSFLFVCCCDDHPLHRFSKSAPFFTYLTPETQGFKIMNGTQ